MTFAGMKRAGVFAALIVGLAWSTATSVHAEDYVLGPEDQVAISVWMHPELERTVTISADGNVTMPPIGEIKAAGLTPKQLGDRLADRLSSYLRTTTTVTVTVGQYMSRSIYVSGQVTRPGRYGFERIPSLVDVLNQAGGAVAGADLGVVQIVRKEGTTRRTITADVAAAMRDGATASLPELKAGDTVIVPGVATSNGATAGEGVGVLGEVNKPGLYTVGGGQDLWNVLAIAGGITARGNLHEVRVLTRNDAGVNVAAIDLAAVLEKGSRAPVTIKPGDVVVVMPRGPSVWNGFIGLLTVGRDALNIAVLADYFNTRKN